MPDLFTNYLLDPDQLTLLRDGFADDMAHYRREQDEALRPPQYILWLLAHVDAREALLSSLTHDIGPLLAQYQVAVAALAALPPPPGMDRNANAVDDYEDWKVDLRRRQNAVDDAQQQLCLALNTWWGAHRAALPEAQR